MRLIDADALKKNYTNTFAEKYGVKGAEMFRDIVNQMPTAYDVEKVVAELEKAECHMIGEHYFEDGISAAIDIVKAGGVE